MSRVRRQAATNFWPGYVDAMTNVVLNLLFMVAMFGITLTIFNDKDKSTAPKQQEAEAAAAATHSAAAGREGSSASGREGPASALAPGVAAPRIESGTLPGTLRGPRRPGAGGPVATRAAGDPRVATSGERNGALPQPVANAVPGAPRVGGGLYPLSGGRPNELNFSVVDAYQRANVPGVRLSQSVRADQSRLLTLGIPVGAEPVAALAQPAVQSALRTALAGSGKVDVWTATRLIDPLLRRRAYLALIAVRSQLVAIGVPPDAIGIRLIEGTAGTDTEKQIFIAAAPAAAE